MPDMLLMVYGGVLFELSLGLGTFEFVKCVVCVVVEGSVVTVSRQWGLFIYLSPPSLSPLCLPAFMACWTSRAVDLFPMASMASSSPVSAVTVRIRPRSQVPRRQRKG
jgi:urea transporter